MLPALLVTRSDETPRHLQTRPGFSWNRAEPDDGRGGRHVRGPPARAAERRRLPGLQVSARPRPITSTVTSNRHELTSDISPTSPTPPQERRKYTRLMTGYAPLRRRQDPPRPVGEHVQQALGRGVPGHPRRRPRRDARRVPVDDLRSAARATSRVLVRVRRARFEARRPRRDVLGQHRGVVRAGLGDDTQRDGLRAPLRHLGPDAVRFICNHAELAAVCVSHACLPVMCCGASRSAPRSSSWSSTRTG